MATSIEPPVCGASLTDRRSKDGVRLLTSAQIRAGASPSVEQGNSDQDAPRRTRTFHGTQQGDDMGKSDARTRARTRENLRMERCLRREVHSPEREEAMMQASRYDLGSVRRDRLVAGAAITTLVIVFGSIIAAIASVIL